MNRRAMLKSIALATAGASVAPRLFAQSKAWHDKVSAYLESLARPDGGYAWEDQQRSHLTPTFAVIGCYHVLKRTPPRKEALIEFVRTHHPSRIKKLEQERRVFEFQQVQALAWLGADVSEFRDTIGAWKAPMAYLKQYERHGYPIFQSETGAIRCRPLLGLTTPISPEWIAYVDSRRRANGSFNNTPATDGGDGHVMNTWWGLQALHVLGRAQENKAETVEWLRSCQLPNGGFTHAPKAEFAGNDDVAYTWAAVRALKLLGSEPRDRAACVTYLHSLANSDGGFGDRAGWLSNATATYFALDALAALDSLDNAPTRKFPIANRKSLPADLKLFTIQLEAPGNGSPSEAVDLARSLRIHLWGAKNAKPEWITRAQSIAQERKVPVQFFVSNEEYGTWVDVPGLGSYSHTSDISAPREKDFGEALSNKGVVSWPEFRERRLAPLTKANGRLIWQFGENEELVRLYLDDSLARGGYAAISTFHFGNPDFTNTEPFLKRYRGQIPFVALQDAHGGESWWWSERLAGFRTFFLATEPTWDGWLNALKNDWVAAVRHDALSLFETWMHGGVTGVQEFLRGHESDWKWWSDEKQLIRPPAAVTLLKRNDPFEKGVPANSSALRIRCWWETTPQGVLKNPVTELVEVKLGSAKLEMKDVTTKNPQGNRTDYFHIAALPENYAREGVARIRVRETGREIEMPFTV
jgi:hypothetical protein